MDVFELAIVIPAFKEHQKIKQCLLSLYKSNLSGFNVVVVDHGESDEISRWINHDFPEVTCLRASSSLWWTGATNVGVKYAVDMGSQWIMPLNHDCYVHTDAISKIMDASKFIDNSIVAPVQFSLRNKKDQVCATSSFLLGFPTIIIPPKWCKKPNASGLISTGLIIGGRGVAIPADIFKSLGYFDEISLPHYGADHDFYLRCKKNGIKLFTCLEAWVDVDDTCDVQDPSKKALRGDGYVNALFKRSSHRNIKDTYTLFSRYYPIPGFALFGMSLYFLRYTLVSFLKFSRSLFTSG